MVIGQQRQWPLDIGGDIILKRILKMSATTVHKHKFRITFGKHKKSQFSLSFCTMHQILALISMNVYPFLFLLFHSSGRLSLLWGRIFSSDPMP